MKEYDIFVPLRYNDGSPVEARKFRDLQVRLIESFNGCAFLPQPNEGYWRTGEVTYRDDIVIYRVVTDKVRRPAKFETAEGRVEKDISARGDLYRGARRPHPVRNRRRISRLPPVDRAGNLTARGSMGRFEGPLMLEYHAAYYQNPEDDGWFVVQLLDFPGVLSQGRTLKSGADDSRRPSPDGGVPRGRRAAVAASESPRQRQASRVYRNDPPPYPRLLRNQVVKRRRLLVHLRAARLRVRCEGGDHAPVRNPATGAETSVPRHREIKPGLVRLICKQSGVPAPSDS